jgi:hypothetical protein
LHQHDGFGVIHRLTLAFEGDPGGDTTIIAASSVAIAGDFCVAEDGGTETGCCALPFSFLWDRGGSEWLEAVDTGESLSSGGATAGRPSVFRRGVV